MKSRMGHRQNTGAGHGFMRAGEDPTNTIEANVKAREESFQRLKAILVKI